MSGVVNPEAYFINVQFKQNKIEIMEMFVEVNLLLFSVMMMILCFGPQVSRVAVWCKAWTEP